MYEVELKVRADHAEVRDRLATLGADSRETVHQTDVYYDAPDRDFAETDEALRIRRTTVDGETTAELTYKGPLLEAKSKSRVEHEVGVTDREETEAILDGLGFEPAATVEKERESFGCEGYTVTLDMVDGLGEFVEVEREVEDADFEDAREGAIELLADLGLDADEQIRTSYLGLLLAGD